MGKPFDKELRKLCDTLRWVDRQDVTGLREFVCANPSQPLISVGSGGSYSACYYSSLLYREYCGPATSATPLMVQMAPSWEYCGNKILYISASGNNKDIIQSVKKGRTLEHVSTASLCATKRNKISLYEEDNPKHSLCHFTMSCKDGFLATNSLLSFFGLLYRAYNPSVRLADEIAINENYNPIQDITVPITSFDYFIILFGRYSEPVAIDLESKLSEAGLGGGILSDYRNFGHGRHNWLDKRGERTCLISLITPHDKSLAEKTLSYLPDNISVLKIETEINGADGTIDLLWKAFYLIAQIGRAQGIDPGRPGVPDFGTDLYHLHYAKLINQSSEQSDARTQAILRKIRYSSPEIIPANLWRIYADKYDEFINRMKRTSFGAIAFDYDGTLSSNDEKSRYKEQLSPEVKKSLERLLKAGIPVAIVSGRGKSIAKMLKKEFADYRFLIYVGYYNGACVCRLEDEKSITDFRNGDIDNQLASMKNDLLHRCPWVQENEMEERNCQLTITTQMHRDLVSKICNEIILSNGYDALQVWESSHSLDVVVRAKADKRNILKMFPDTNVLFIGDSGDFQGNDFQMLSTPYSLSVDKTSVDPDSCWNIVPQGLSGVRATLWYLSKLMVKNNAFRIKLRNE